MLQVQIAQNVNHKLASTKWFLIIKFSRFVPHKQKQKRLTATKRQQKKLVDSWYVRSTQSIHRLKLFLYEYREKFWEKSIFIQFFFANFCLGDHYLIEICDLPGLML